MKYLILILLFLGSHAVRLCGQTILPTPDYLEKPMDSCNSKARYGCMLKMLPLLSCICFMKN